MPANKDALIRYRVINRCLVNKFNKYPSKNDLREACMEALGLNFISVRTIEKDIEDMRYNDELGYKAPIAFSKVEKGYYYTEKDYSIDKIPLNIEEVNALQFAVSILEQLKGVSLMQQFSGAVEKIVEALNIKRHNKESEKIDFIEFDNPPYVPGGHLLNLFVESIQEKAVVEFFYKKHGTKASKKYQLEPYLLKEFRNIWYIIGKYEHSHEVRIFGLDRIGEVQKLKRKFDYDTSFDKDKFFKNSFGITSVLNDPVDVVLSFNPVTGDYIKSLPLHHSQQIIESNEKECIVKLHLFPTYELYMQILSYGSGVKVLEPEFLKEKIVDFLNETLKQYQD